MSMRVSAVLSACVLILTCLGCPAGSSAQGRKELRVGIAVIPAVVDPAAALEGATPLIARQVFDTLVVYREGTTEIEPALAIRWAVSREGLVWTFALREGVKFHDGSALTAAEVAASFQRGLAADATGAAWPALLRGRPGVIKDVRATDARTVQFVLNQPYAPLLTVLAHPGLAIAKTATASDGIPRLIGSGPYRVVDAVAGRVAIEAVAG